MTSNAGTAPNGDDPKTKEVERIMRAFKKNPYDILDLPLTATESEVKKQYRKKSLMIHPDKFKHENGMEAFDHLKKAEGILSDRDKRGEIDSIMKLARSTVLKRILGSGYSTSITDDDPRLQNLRPSYDAQIRLAAKDVFSEEEVDKNKKNSIQKANEAAEKARLDAEVAARKRKAEEQVKWEERREERVSGWRDYNKKAKAAAVKKRKKDAHVLG